MMGSIYLIRDTRNGVVLAKWLATISLHSSLLAVYGTKHTRVWVFAMGAPPVCTTMGSGFLAVHPVVKLEHLLVVGVHRERCAAVPEGSRDVADMLEEGRAQMEQVEVRLEGDRLCQLRDGIFLLMVVHQH